MQRPKVGFVSHPACLAHDPGRHHPERPARLEAILTQIERSGLREALAIVTPEPASEDVLRLIHPPAYLEDLKQPIAPGGHRVLDPDTLMSSKSFEAVLAAVGALLAACDRIMDGSLQRVFAAVRPPGHHAGREIPMGFCLVNNIAIAARYLQQRHHLTRILIVDWDVHHGNGTQAIFYEDPTVFYVSSHQYPFYPGTGSRSERGRGAGEGTTLNLPLQAGSTDAVCLKRYETEVLPAARAFKPECLLVSCGFDGHAEDPLAGLKLTEEGFRRLTELVVALAKECCGGRVISVLEGGYNLRALQRSVEAHLQGLLI